MALEGQSHLCSEWLEASHPDAMKHNAMKPDLVRLLSSMVIPADLANLMAVDAT